LKYLAYRESRNIDVTFDSKRVDTLNMKRCFENVNRMQRNAYSDVREYTHFAELTFRYLARVLPRRFLWFSDLGALRRSFLLNALVTCVGSYASQAQRPNFRVWIEYECYFGETRNVFEQIFWWCHNREALHRM